MEIMGTLYFLFLCINAVSGFHVRTRSTEISSSQTNDDLIVQNLLKLIVNEQNSRLHLQNKLDQLENAQVQMKKTSYAKINQTDHEMVKKVNEMSSRLIQLEHFNADVSRQLEKEKNNREHLEEMYTALEKRVNNLKSTTEAKLSNITAGENYTHNRLANISKERGPVKQLIGNMTTVRQPNFDKSVGFSVIVPDPSSVSGSNDPLRFQTLIDNTGRNYNLSTGVFTCQYPGLYFITATIFRSTTTRRTTESYCYFYVNKQRYNIVSSGAGAQEVKTSGTQSMVYLLTVRDRVYLSSCGGVDHMSSYSSFSGFLISN